MYIKLTDTKTSAFAEVLCDVCGQPLDLDEDCEYLTPRNGIDSEASIAHRMCARRPGRFTNHWSRVTSARFLLRCAADQDRHPLITKLLNDLNEERKNRIH